MATTSAPRTVKRSTRQGYFPVLDALRFLLAFWVAVGHFEMIPLFGDYHTGTGYWLLFKHAWSTIVFGTPAVIVFFVISGFCIHLPFRGTQPIDVPRYYLRRYTRILIPVAGALIVYRSLGQHFTFWGEHSILWESPLWSLACEEIYYAAYPFLRWFRNKRGWKFLFFLSFVTSVLIASTHPHAANWHVFGPFGTALMLLPVWLLGCLLAEQSESLLKLDSKISIWYWRFFAWFGCWISEMLHFKLKISYTQTMVWFGVLAYFWVRQEIIHGKNHPPNRYLVAGGAWSYSLYLVHAHGGSLPGALHVPSFGLLPDWFIVMFSSLAFGYLFYLAVERPSHRLARKIRVKGASSSVAKESSEPTMPAVSVVVAGEMAPAKDLGSGS